MATKINSCSRVLIRNCRCTDQEDWLSLPYSEDEFEAFLESIGVIADDDEETETDTYDLLMSGECITKYEVVGHESGILSDDDFADLNTANELVERLESLDVRNEELIHALMQDGDSLKEAIEAAEDCSADFYPNTSLESLAEQYVDEGFFTQEFLMKFIDLAMLLPTTVMLKSMTEF